MTFSNPAGVPRPPPPPTCGRCWTCSAAATRSRCWRAAPWLDRRLQGLDDARSAAPRRRASGRSIEVVQHLADSELVFGYRVRMMLTEDRPPLQGYDQDRWAGELRYRDVPLDLALDQLRGLRAANLQV